jgi:hypothetical protein
LKESIVIKNLLELQNGSVSSHGNVEIDEDTYAHTDMQVHAVHMHTHAHTLPIYAQAQNECTQSKFLHLIT